MGAWGAAITSDDTVSDVIAAMVSCLKAGASLTEAADKVLVEFRQSVDDGDEGPLIWLGIAHAQWKYGAVDEKVLHHIRDDVMFERGLDRWRDDPEQMKRRQEVLSRFLAKISLPNAKPASIPKTTSRLAPFAAGDCLSVLTADSRYTAAIVLGVDNSRIEYGTNLVASLDYLSDMPPTPAVFEGRKWLVKHHGNWNGERELIWLGSADFKKEQRRFVVICQTKVRFFDPKKSESHGSWKMLGSQILLCRAAGEASQGGRAK